MGAFGGYYKGEQKKKKQKILEEKARKASLSSTAAFTLPILIRKEKKTG